MIEIMDYRPINKGYLLGVVNIKIKDWHNFIIRRIKVFDKQGNRWINMPSEEYEKDGKKQYFALNAFEDPKLQMSFQNKFFNALETYLSKTQPQQNTQNSVESVSQENELPF